ncbi:uncharacterized protein [Venturia canescens]|uniref:uncharacterized protein n=1 Tax=Venturia canescens TaxID=32260 RepID=UPI001C9BC15E|nr:uncharacterized protein LOC122415233 [Venturia canescens]
MTKPCAVPQCKTGSRGFKIKRSVFKVPSNSERLKKWQSAIPNRQLTSSHFVCEKHFEEKYILRKYIKHDTNGQVIAEVDYKHPRLVESAIPTLFDEPIIKTVEERNSSTVEDCTQNCVEGSTIDDHSVAVDELPMPMDIAAVIPSNDLLMDVSAEAHDHCSQSINGTPTENTDLSSHQVVTDTTFDISSVTISGAPSTTYFEIGEDCVKSLPVPWVVGQLYGRPDQYLVFLYPEVYKKHGIEIPITARAVTVDRQKNVRYFVHGNLINNDEGNLRQKLDSSNDLPDVLIKFQQMNLCCGIGKVNIHFVPTENSFQNYSDEWHHNKCPLLWKKRRCEHCYKLRKNILAKEKRAKDPHSFNRISRLRNPIDDQKLMMMKKKMLCERRGKHRAMCQLSILRKSLKAHQLEIATIKEETLEERCSELLVPATHKTAMKEIIAAASAKNPKGRRYSEDWIMLCLIMNIRSPAYYEFLRKNNVMPLPSKRTIRSYFSLINTKCGFDEQFSHLLKKHFDEKTAMQRHGILLLDEINLRKSVAVCSKNLTYSGLTDFGDDGPQATNLEEQATHGLVMMFQPLADKYTQPIAVFALKNSVKGDELAKLVVKAIVYLENCGAKIHGVIADGAKTNQKMWSLLDVRAGISNTKSWFTHPLDNERKVFVFSDAPHVFKNIRNRLYNKRRLRTSPDKKYVDWKFFEALFNVDTQHVGNARACPKLSKRHIELDNTSKMRVRLATQIFSNSVAQGLAFYASQKFEALADCEETIAFCKRLNDTFDALNRKTPNEGLTPQSPDFKVLQDTLQWLNDWQSDVLAGKLSSDEFLTQDTSTGLRLSLTSTMDMCVYLINKFDFKYLLTGKVNQDDLEKFFSTIRQAAGCNDHPNCPTFLQLYKLLSIYSVIKPPKYGNCTVTAEPESRILVSLNDLKGLNGEDGKQSESKMAKCKEEIRQRLDKCLTNESWEADDVIEFNPEHDYALSPAIDCIIYYVTGLLF